MCRLVECQISCSAVSTIKWFLNCAVLAERFAYTRRIGFKNEIWVWTSDFGHFFIPFVFGKLNFVSKTGIKDFQVIWKLGSNCTLSRSTELIFDIAASRKIFISNARELIPLKTDSLALKEFIFEIDGVLTRLKEVPSGVEKVWIEEFGDDSVDEPLGLDHVNGFLLRLRIWLRNYLNVAAWTNIIEKRMVAHIKDNI